MIIKIQPFCLFLYLYKLTRLVCFRIVVNIIKPRMEMDGLNTKAHLGQINLKRFEIFQDFEKTKLLI